MSETRLPLNPTILCAALDLGVPHSDPVVLKAGSVSTWHVVSTGGEFHIKLWPADTWNGLAAELGVAAEIEVAARALHIDMPEPVALNRRLDGCVATVHRWVDSRPVSPADNVAVWVGSTLARLHTIPAPLAPGPPPTTYGIHPLDDWERWADEAATSGLAWAGSARRGRGDVLMAGELISEGLASDSRRVGSHRDLHGENVLVSGGGFLLSDWDLAGPEVPWFETVRAAIEFGRLAGTRDAVKPARPDPDTTRVVIREYVRSGGEPGMGGQIALAGVLGMTLARLSHHSQVSLGDRAGNPEERSWSADYLVQAYPKLAGWITALDELAVLVDPAEFS